MRPPEADEQFSRWDAYAAILRRTALEELDVASAMESELRLYVDDQIGIFYAPFDHLELNARIAIVGVTPGPTQAFAAIRSVRAGVQAGLNDQRLQAAVKHEASFKGMRGDLVSWLDAVGLAHVLELDSCDELFSSHPQGLVHTTSAVRYPTFRRTRDGWQNWNGYEIAPLEHRVLKAMITCALGPELHALRDAVVVPLGKANEAVAYLCDHGQLDASRCVLGFPHPSPASARRHQIFAARQGNLARQVERLRARQAVRASTPTTAARLSAPFAPSCGDDDEIRIELTTGNIRNGHFYLRRHLSFFPGDAVGAANRADGVGTTLEIHFAGDPEVVTTDIAGGNKLMFRCRARTAAFFRRHALGGGDALAVRRLGPREYDVRPLKR